MNGLCRKIRKAVAVILCGAACLLSAPTELYADTEPVVVVLDPGHGGSNEGGQYGDFLEKDLTLKVAEAMKEELEKYENVVVYLTRTEDVELSLDERVDFAQSVGADFFFCLHFNMSEQHTLYGAECWVSAYGDCYAKGYDFAAIEMEQLTSLGLYNRGIKTRISATRDADYYGVIRRATAIGMPSVIIEHCHLDHPADAPFIDQENWPKRYGVADATAVAQYFGLKSAELGVDYGGVTYSATEVPSTPMYPDTTPPEECTVEQVGYNAEKNAIQIRFRAYDAESRMLYYTWSTDGGETFGELQPWPDGEQEVTFEIPFPEDGQDSLVVRGCNLYDLAADSAAVDISQWRLADNAERSTEISEKNTEEIPAAAEAEQDSSGHSLPGWLPVLLIALAAVLTVVFVFAAVRGYILKSWRVRLLLLILLAALLAVVLLMAKNQDAAEGAAREELMAEGTGAGAEETTGTENAGAEETTGTEATTTGKMTGAEATTTGESTAEAAAWEISEGITMEQEFYTTELSAQLREYITGISYPDTGEELLISYEELSYVHVLHYDFDGQVQEGELICNKAIAGDLLEIFEELYQAQYPIERIALVDAYGGDDEASMEDNNSSCFNYRVISGTTRISNHAYGLAIDINPLYNPYITGSGDAEEVQPVNGVDYTDRTLDFSHKIDHEDLCYRLFTEHGFTWGGDWSSSKDYQHFEKKI
jgi:N-acetylmuramoyl-L-alanine amidase